MTDRLPVICRPASTEDTADMLALTKTSWDGDDYVPQVGDEWRADPHGRLVVAEYKGKVIGLGKLTRLSGLDWWLEGLRVDPAYEGLGVASQMQAEIVATWERIGSGSLRLLTSAKRLAIHRLCHRLGFSKVGEYVFCTVPCGDPGETPADMTPGDQQPTLPFRPLMIAEVQEATDFALNSPIRSLTGELIDLGWQLALPRPRYTQQAVERCQAWWWRVRQGLLIFHESREDPPNKTRLAIEVLACLVSDLSDLLLDFRRLAGGFGYQDVCWMAANQPELMSILEGAGFQRDGEHILYAFSKSRD